jgi:hypothetical protein
MAQLKKKRHGDSPVKHYPGSTSANSKVSSHLNLQKPSKVAVKMRHSDSQKRASLQEHRSRNEVSRQAKGKV